MKRYLIIQTAFIGDVILATALIEKLSQTSPKLQIDFLVRKGNESLLTNHPNLNEVIVWDKQKSKYKNLFGIVKSIRRTKYDAVINVHRFTASGLMTILSKAKLKIGYTQNPFSFGFDKKIKHEIGNGTHEVERNQKLIESLIKDTTLVFPKLFPSLQDFENIQKFTNKPYVCLAPASVWETKQLPKIKWVELIDKLSDKYDSIYLLGGPNDVKHNHSILVNTKSGKGINLAGQLSLLASAALMKKAEMNYVNDSAPMHLASAMNAPVTAFFCSTIPSFGFGPLSQSSRVIETSEKLACRPCGLHGKKSCPEGHFKCGLTILID